jgi:hypothetical protein
LGEGIFYYKHSEFIQFYVCRNVEIYIEYKELLMSLPLIRKPFLIQGLAFTVAILMMNTTQAATEQEQIQQLREEVKELRALLEQYVPQSKQKTTLPVSDSAQVLAAQTTTPSSDTNKNRHSLFKQHLVLM